MITLSINLAALKHVREQRKTKDGKTIDCIVIACEPNNLAFTEKGNLYINAVAWPRKTASKFENDKSTHLINQSLPKEVRDQMTDAGVYPPTIGSLTAAENQAAQTYQEPQPYSSGGGDFVNSSDDLPF